MNPADKRLAVQVEDHPVSYIHFAGVIPEGNYGAGVVEVWDKGIFFAVDEKLAKLTERQALKALENGELKFFLKGEKLEGSFVLVKMKTAGEKNWLLIKHKDEWAFNKKYDSEEHRKTFRKKTAKKKL
jgi:bifunctional non-homologous end joining protein LigD